MVDREQDEWECLWRAAGVQGLVRALIVALIKKRVITVDEYRDALAADVGEVMLRRGERSERHHG